MNGKAVLPQAEGVKPKSPTAPKKSAAEVLDGYRKRMYEKYKEMYENGNYVR